MHKAQINKPIQSNVLEKLSFLPKFNVTRTLLQLASNMITCNEATKQNPSGKEAPQMWGQFYIC